MLLFKAYKAPPALALMEAYLCMGSLRMCSSGIILIDIFFKNPMQCQMTCRRNVAARALGAGIISKNPGRDFARRRTFKNKKKSNLIMGFGAPILHQICLFSSWVYVLAGAHMGVRS